MSSCGGHASLMHEVNAHCTTQWQRASGRVAPNGIQLGGTPNERNLIFCFLDFAGPADHVTGCRNLPLASLLATARTDSGGLSGG